MLRCKKCGAILWIDDDELEGLCEGCKKIDLGQGFAEDLLPLSTLGVMR